MRSLLTIVLTGFMMLAVRALAGINDTVIGIANSHSGTGVALSDSCAFCHDGKTLVLKSESDDLCYVCHDNIREKSSKSHRHIAVVSDRFPGFGCEGCHLIHRAPGNHLLQNDELELCRSCHVETKRGKSHPVVSYTDAFGAQTAVLGPDGRPVTCASHCHDVHGADNNFLCRLEPGRELCISCHTELGE